PPPERPALGRRKSLPVVPRAQVPRLKADRVPGTAIVGNRFVGVVNQTLHALPLEPDESLTGPTLRILELPQDLSHRLSAPSLQGEIDRSCELSVQSRLLLWT